MSAQREKISCSLYLRFVQVNIQLLIARVAFGSHDILDIIQKGVKAFVDNHPCFPLRFLELLILILQKQVRQRRNSEIKRRTMPLGQVNAL